MGVRLDQAGYPRTGAATVRSRKTSSPEDQPPVAMEPVRFAGNAPGRMQQLKIWANRLQLNTVSLIDNVFSKPQRDNIPLNKAVFTVLDIETTGLEPRHNDLIELTAIKYRNGKIIRRFSTLVKPTMPIPDRVRKLTGITNEMVGQAPAAETVLKDFARFIGPNPLLVGHYLNFDLGFLKEKLTANDLGAYSRRLSLSKSFCTKTLAMIAMPDLPGYSGVEIGKHLGIVNDKPHRSEADVKMTAGLFFKMLENLKKELKGQKLKMETLGNLRDYQGHPLTDYKGLPPRLSNPADV